MATDSWRVVPVAELCESIYDGPHATPRKTQQGSIFLGISNLSNGRLDLSETEHLSEEDFVQWTRRITPRPYDIVFSYETRLGEAAMIPEGLRCCLGRRMALMRPDPNNVVPRFLLYAYLGPEFQSTLRARTIHGSTVDRIPLIDFPNFPIRVPSLPVQRRIADILGALDDKIEVNRRINATLEAMAQALFKHWFVDFGPFQDGPFVETELGPVPEGWKVGHLRDMCRLTMGASPKSEFYNDVGEGLPFHQGVTDFGDRFPKHRRFCTVTDRLAAQGDVLVSVRAPVGRINVADRQIVIGRGLAAARHIKHCNSFVLYLMKCIFKEEDVIGSGTIFNSVSRDDLENIKFVVPPEEVVLNFEKRVTNYDEQIAVNHVQNSSLATIRDYLLPKLLSGEITVEAAEETVAETI